MKKFIYVVLGILCLNIAHAVSEDIPNGGMTPPEMAKILVDKGYRAEIHYADSDDTETYITSSTQGKIFSIYFYDLANDNRAGSIQYCISFKANEKIDSRAVLDWNANYRYARMYLSKSNSSYFEMDRDIERGWTRAAIENDFERWDSLVSTIVKYINKLTANTDSQS